MFDDMWKAAQTAGQVAAEAENAKLGPEKSRGLDCGFAWIVVKPARGPFADFLKRQPAVHKRDYGGGGLEVWYRAFHNLGTQSISVHHAAVCAAYKVLERELYAKGLGDKYKLSIGLRLDLHASPREMRP